MNKLPKTKSSGNNPQSSERVSDGRALVVDGEAGVDVTKRERDAEKLREYEKVVEGLEEMIGVVDRNYRYLLANRAFLRHRGKERHEVVGHFIWEVLAPDVFYEIVKPKLDECFTGRVVTYELEHSYPNAGLRNLSISYFPIEGANGVDRVACILNDITTRKRAEDALKQSEGQMSEAQHLAHVGSWTWNLDSNVLTWSDELYEIFGEAKGTFIPTFEKFIEHVHPDDREDTASTIAHCRQAHQPFSARRRIIRPNGEVRTLDSHISVLMDGNGKPVQMLGACQDVTESVNAESARLLAERKYRDIFENASDGIFQSTPEGRYIAANPALARMYGYASPEALIKDCRDISQQIYADSARREEFKRLIEAEGQVRDFEMRTFRKDGSTLWVSVNARAVRDERGQIQYYEGFGTNITDRKVSEEALRISEEKYKNIFYFAPIGIYQSLRDGTILTANQTLADLLGYDSVEELLTRNLVRDVYFDSADREALIGEFERRDFAGDVDIQWKRKDGSPIWVHLVAHAFKVDGLTQYFEGFAREVTDEKRAQDALAESEQRYRELFENSRDAIYVHDINGRYTSVNRAAEELCGYNRAEIIGKHYSNFIAPSYLREARESFCRKLDVPIETTYEAEVICKDGVRKPVEISSRMIYQDGQELAIQGTVRDITERKRAQRTLRTYSQRLIQAQEAERESMSRELHDEIGQALTAISMNLEWIRRAGAPSEAVAERIHESIEVIDDTLRRVRELSLELRPALLDDLGLAAALSWYAERFSARTGIVTVVSGDCPHHRTQRAVQTALFRIAQEALTNTARHAHASKAQLNLEQDDGHLQLSISDDGVGFDSEALFNGSSVMALGLRGMQERAHAIKGSLNINSIPGSGTQVVVVVPLVIAANSRVSN